MRSDADAVGDIIATRTFDRADGPVELRVHKPSPYPDPRYDADPANPPWRCFYTIVFPDGETKRGYSVGVDSVQALLLAFSSAGHRVRHVGNGTPALRPPAQWLGEDDLGLSIPDFE